MLAPALLSSCALAEAIAASGCKDVGVFSFSVDVRDASSNARINPGSTISWTGTSTGSIVVGDSAYTAFPVLGPAEQTGPFTIRVQHAGYAEWTDDINVSKDGCHPKTVGVVALMKKS